MATYVVIETKDPYERRSPRAFQEVVRGLAARGNRVVLFLAQDAVQAARPGSRFAQDLATLAQQGISVRADRFGLRERGIAGPAPGVEESDISDLIPLILEPGAKAFWH